MSVFIVLVAAKIIRYIEIKDVAVIPVIVLSVNIYTKYIAALSAAGMNGHLSKFINFDIICKTGYNAAEK